jgi:uncharacterized protein HemX
VGAQTQNYFFFNKQALVNNLDEIKKKDMHKVDMSSVMLKLSAVAKRIEGIPESPDRSPSKIPSVARDLLPGQKQRQNLQNLTVETSDSMTEYSPIVSSISKKRVNVSLFKSDKKPATKKGKGKGKTSKKP